MKSIGKALANATATLFAPESIAHEPPRKILIKKGRTVQEIADNDLAETLERLYLMWLDARELEPALKELKSAIAEAALNYIGEDETSLTFETTETRVTVKFNQELSIPLESVSRLLELLGDRFDDLTDSKIAYKPTRKLKELALSDPEIAECIKVANKAPTVTISAATN